MNKTPDTCVFTVVYPGLEPWLPDFADSVMQQDYNAFDLVVVNDGLDPESLAKLQEKCRCHLLEPAGDIAANRRTGFRFMQNAGYRHTVFADSDDLMAADRVRVTAELLGRYDIVANDLDIIGSSGEFIKRAFWSDRLQDMSTINKEDMYDSNIIGLGNSGVRTSILTGLEIPSYVRAVDWYVYTILLNRGHSAVFTSRTTTYYRQHDANILGIGASEMNEADLKKEIRMKAAHYRVLQNLSAIYARKHEYYSALESNIDDRDELVRHMACRSISEDKNPFWFETV